MNGLSSTNLLGSCNQKPTDKVWTIHARKAQVGVDEDVEQGTVQ